MFNFDSIGPDSLATASGRTNIHKGTAEPTQPITADITIQLPVATYQRCKSQRGRYNNANNTTIVSAIDRRYRVQKKDTDPTVQEKINHIKNARLIVGHFFIVGSSYFSTEAMLFLL